LTNDQSRIKELELQVEFLTQQIKELLAQNAILEAKLSNYLTKKNSSNSSTPPSQDPHRLKRTESLRVKSGLPPGGQSGHQGHFLEITDDPTDTIVHSPDYCTCCGKSLHSIPSVFSGKRQVIDIPAVHPTVTEHQIYSKRCTCGHLTESSYPPEAHSAVCYGSNLQSLTAYFHARQYIPYQRMREMYREIFGLSISSGSLVNMVSSFAANCKGIYEEIHRRVSASSVVGADETGVCIKGKNHWAWVFQTPQATYIHTDKSRGKKVIDQLFPQGFPQTILVHDCWSPYFGVPTKGHQICTAHLWLVSLSNHFGN
jgi:transposase